ncbi:MAG: lysoplasmalogenase [Bacilli bacterium]|nr:lysoplasmalogenase [Bacilli bacterium]
MLKSIVSLLFVVLGVYGVFTSTGHKLPILVAIGLILGLLGDIWLDLKFIYEDDDKNHRMIYTRAGFITFGIGHILFVFGMLVEYLGKANPLYAVLPMVGAIVLAIANVFVSKLLKLRFGVLKVDVIVYSILLFSTPLTALSLCILTSFKVTTLIMLLLGGVLFALSDIVLSGTYFGEDHEKPIDFVLNYLTYYSAQFMIAFSLFFI